MSSPSTRDRAGSRAGEPVDEPVVLALDSRDRHREVAFVDHRAGLVSSRPLRGAASPRPRCPRRTARSPTACTSRRHVGSRLPRGPITAATTVFGSRRRCRPGACAGEVRQEPRVRVHDSGHPRSRPAALCERRDRVEVRTHPEAVAAVACRLDRLQRACGLEEPDVLHGHAPVGGGLLGPTPQVGDQLPACGRSGRLACSTVVVAGHVRDRAIVHHFRLIVKTDVMFGYGVLRCVSWSPLPDSPEPSCAQRSTRLRLRQAALRADVDAGRRRDDHPADHRRRRHRLRHLLQLRAEQGGARARRAWTA